MACPFFCGTPNRARRIMSARGVQEPAVVALAAIVGLLACPLVSAR